MGTEVKELLLERDEPPGSLNWNSWRWQLRNAVRNAETLEKIIPLNSEQKQSLSKVIAKYPLAITPYYLSLIDRNNPQDAVRMQCVPSAEEMKLYFEMHDDPLGEEDDSVLPGLIHRYPDRVLLVLTNMCPVYCRHCTRKRQWCKGNWISRPKELENTYRYIEMHTEIRDVILSGGDPLILSTAMLEGVLSRLRQIRHVEIVRIGTRCPVVLPQRIDAELVAMLKKYRPLWVNTHFNHPNEITKESARAADMMLCAGLALNNQSVLLKGINDSVEIMTRLCQRLLGIGVRPYYLFQCDPVSGTAHFRTSVEKGIEIIRAMRGFTSGLCVPTFVVDGLKGQGKVPLAPNYLVSKEDNYMLLEGYEGKRFKYYNPED
ncbi:MAG: KamA family radical SAM protein [Candidatus Omnitrophota bacterium]|nr:MAG: KamA family radical SAM protein [Candidatus Omnitrophota bacterium]